MIWRALQFDWPQASVFLLLVLVVAWLFFYLFSFRKKKLQEFAAPSVLEVVVEKREPVFYWAKTLLFCIACTCGILALMQPKGNERYISTAANGQVAIKKQSPTKVNLRKNTHEVIFLLDASASMKIADVQGKTRLDISKEIVDDVIRHLKGANISLFAFTSATMQIVPSTLDYLFTRLMLQQISINEGETEGTNFKQALQSLREQYFLNSSPKTKTLIIFSDGGDTNLMGLEGEKRKQEMVEIVSPVADAAEKNLKVFTVGVGSSQGQEIPGVSFQGKPVISNLGESLLRRLSSIGRGDFFIAGEMTPFQISQRLSQLIAQQESFVDSSVEMQPLDMGRNTHIYDLYFQWPLGLAVLALLGFLLIPDTRKQVEKKNAT